MSERRRMTSFDAEIVALEKQLAAKKAEKAAALNNVSAKPAEKVATKTEKAAVGDNEIRNWTEKITNEDNKELMGEIKALEDKIAEEEMGPLDAGDDAADEMPVEASAKKADDAEGDEEIKAEDADMDKKAEDDKEAGDVLEQNDRAMHNWPNEHPDADMATKAKAASKKKADEGQPQGEIEEEIENDHNQMVEEFKPDMEGDNILPVAEQKKMMAKTVSAKELQASKLKEAAKRLDRVASYLEKHGRKQLAYRIDKVSDAIEAKLKSL